MFQETVNPGAPPSGGNAETPTRQEQYQMVRAQIEHENTLIGQRITWYLTFQGFLFTAATLAIGLLDHGKLGSPVAVFPRGSVTFACSLLGGLGILSSVVCFWLIYVANVHAEKVKAWWLAREPSDERYPPITGTGGVRAGKLHITAAYFIIPIIGVWGYFIWLFSQGSSA